MRLAFCFLMFSFFLAWNEAAGQSRSFDRPDSLRGYLSAERSFYDVGHYDLTVRFEPESKSITGHNRMTFRVLDQQQRQQIDLFPNMSLDSVLYNGEHMQFEREYSAIWILWNEAPEVGSIHSLDLYFSGKPQIARRPPWGGGFVWDEDAAGNPHIGVAVQGTGASLWWPNKDHLSDEPDSMDVRLDVPDQLMAISNGRKQSVERSEPGREQWHWKIHHPINNYNVTFYLGEFVHQKRTFTTAEGNSYPLDFYLLSHRSEEDFEHFKQTDEMLRIFEALLGPYPFPEDGFKIVEAPYWGMEHQSAIAYGNDLQNNEYGFDFILIHESGHEYFGNSISVSDLAHMWVHEAFTTYLEALYLEKKHDYATALDYLNRQRTQIRNQRPIVGSYGVNDKPTDTDQYYKGTWMLQTLRVSLADDELWFKMLRELHESFRVQVVEGQQIIDFINTYTNGASSSILDHYLFQSEIPLLQTYFEGEHFYYRWANASDEFQMNFQVVLGGEPVLLSGSTKWQKISVNEKEISVNHRIQLFNLKKMKK
ncbi:MAG: M1 family metallopeptidase [Cyclobacteriaceae bacterium]|nr:M1 family metallopeptidase [Cyclobacteriaceae bacterium]